MKDQPTEFDEAKMLHKVDLDEMASKSRLVFLYRLCLKL